MNTIAKPQVDLPTLRRLSGELLEQEGRSLNPLTDHAIERARVETNFAITVETEFRALEPDRKSKRHD